MPHATPTSVAAHFLSIAPAISHARWVVSYSGRFLPDYPQLDCCVGGPRSSSAHNTAFLHMHYALSIATSAALLLRAPRILLPRHATYYRKRPHAFLYRLPVVQRRV